MDKSKIIVVGLIVFVLLVALLIVRSMFSDDTEPISAEMLQAQSTLIELSDMATDDARSSSTRLNAASILSTTTTDYRYLQKVHQDRYGSTVDAVDTIAVEELEGSRENYDNIYNELANDFLEISINRLNLLRRETKDPVALEAIDAAISNQESQLERIQN